MNHDLIDKLLRIANATMHFPKLKPIHDQAMAELEEHATALLPEAVAPPEPPTEDQGEDMAPPMPPPNTVAQVEAAQAEHTDRRF